MKTARITAPWRPLPTALTAPAFAPGSVWLVGAGPGDPGLLTLHAAHALTEADVVLHDALVSPAVLGLASQARLVAVGKRAGLRSPSQLRINQRLIDLARQGLRVVRLKGGDPLIFGRGAEEALALAAASIPFRIIPGITAGIGGTAAAGIPLTHRHLARSVTFATGHDSGGGLSDTDWGKLGAGSDVLVLYMARGQIAQIAPRLIAAGRDAGEAVALIANATTPAQTVHLTTLAGAPASALDPPVDAPVLIVIGPVIALRSMLTDWQQADPMTLALPAAELAQARG